MRMATEYSAKRPLWLWIGLGGCLLIILVCVGGLVAAGLTGSIWVAGPQRITITSVILTTGVDAQGKPIDNVTHFASTVGRIYCVVTIDAPKPVQVGARWYYNNTLIYDQAITVDKSGYMALYRKDGTPFPEGQYRVEIYLVKETERTVYFTVGQ